MFLFSSLAVCRLRYSNSSNNHGRSADYCSRTFGEQFASDCVAQATNFPSSITNQLTTTTITYNLISPTLVTIRSLPAIEFQLGLVHNCFGSRIANFTLAEKKTTIIIRGRGQPAHQSERGRLAIILGYDRKHGWNAESPFYLLQHLLSSFWRHKILSTAIYPSVDHNTTEYATYHLHVLETIPPRCQHKLSGEHMAYGGEHNR